jgi:hypothetical protein
MNRIPAAQALELAFKDCRITRVYGRVDGALGREIVQLWVGSGVLDPAEAQRRLSEVYFTVRDGRNRLIGVSTVYLGDFLQQGDAYWFLRMFLLPDARGDFELASFVSRQSRLALRHQDNHGATPIGVIIVTENPKLWRKGAHRVLFRDGWRFWGRGPKGNEIWYENFDGSEIQTKPA